MPNWPRTDNTDGAAQQHVQSPVGVASANGRHLTAIYNTDDHAALQGQTSDEDGVGIRAVNSGGGVALRAEGIAEVDGNLLVSGNINADTIGHDCVVGNNSAETHLGQQNHATRVQGNLQVVQNVGVGGLVAPGFIDGLGGGGGQDLNIGTLGTTDEVNIGRADHPTNVTDDLNVGGNLDVTGNAQVDGTLDVDGNGNVDGNLVVDGTLVVGPAGLPAKIDAANGQNLNLGGENSTAEVVLGRDGQNVRVLADLLQVLGGPLQVGPTGAAGQIDSGGVALGEQDLEIGGGDGTADLLLGKVNQLIQLLTTLRINGNRIELDDAGDAWIEFHPRELPGFSSIDFATEGQVRFYVDRDGGRNA